MAVILSNKDDASKRLFLGPEWAGRTFRDGLEHHEANITIEEDGWADFPVHGGSVSAWILAD